MSPVRALVAGLGAALLLAGCADDNPPSPYPPTPGPTAVSAAAQSYVLRPSSMAAYSRTEDATVSARTIADQESNPALLARISSQGLVDGARVTYSTPTNAPQPPPFVTVIDEALVFRDATGAIAFVADESGRRNRPPQGGTIAPLTGMPDGGTDQLIGYLATVPAQTGGDPAAHAFFVLLRRGRVVAELLGTGPLTTATVPLFAGLLTQQEQLLASSPDL